MRTAIRLTIAVFAFVLAATTARAEEIRVLSSVGIKAVIEVLGPQFERATKHKVTTMFDLAGVLKTRIEGGEPFDVAILTPAMIDELISKGKIAPATRVEVARTGLGLMMRAGAPKREEDLPRVGGVRDRQPTARRPGRGRAAPPRSPVEVGRARSADERKPRRWT